MELSPKLKEKILDSLNHIFTYNVNGNIVGVYDYRDRSKLKRAFTIHKYDPHLDVNSGYLMDVVCFYWNDRGIELGRLDSLVEIFGYSL